MLRKETDKMDMRLRKFFPLMILLIVSGQLFAQRVPLIAVSKPAESAFAKKFRLGISSNTYWSSLHGPSLAADYFAKPSLGFLVSGEYFPLPFLGFGAGIGFQQRGAGIKNVDKVPVTGLNPDSVYNERLRFNTVEVPLTIILRTPRDFIKGVRWSLSGGIVPMRNIKTNDVFNSYEAGLRQIDNVTDVSKVYFKNDVAWQITAGPDIDSGGRGIFKFHFVYSQGTTNVYTNNQGKAHNQTIGFRVSFMF